LKLFHSIYQTKHKTRTQYFYADIVTLPDDGCRVVRVKAKLQGHTEIKASYFVKNIQLESTVTIAAYDPLQVRKTYFMCLINLSQILH